MRGGAGSKALGLVSVLIIFLNDLCQGNHPLHVADEGSEIDGPSSHVL